MRSEDDIVFATRDALVAYLRSWGMSITSESETDLIDAALETFRLHGPGLGPMNVQGED